MRYVKAKCREREELVAYRNYVTDSFYYRGQDKYINCKYSDMINKKPKDNRTGDEIALDVIIRAGLKFKGD